MDGSLRVIVTDVTNPYFNLATEDWIFNDMPLDQKVLFLWRNEPSIIVGRGQNVWSECRLEAVESDGVHVVRRHSGGGAVYQDLGNTCFTFMCAKEPHHTTKQLYARNNEILVAALGRLGVSAAASGRNDIVVEHQEESFKVSGSAFRESKDRCFHHGTMLLDVDLGRLSGYLTPDSKKLQAKGIKSVASRVCNLNSIRSGLDHQVFVDALIDEYFRYYDGRCEIETLEFSHLEAVAPLNAYYQKLQSWDWVYGKTPSFETTWRDRLSFGSCEVHLDADQGKIRRATLFTDSLDPDPILAVASFLEGQPYSKEGLEAARQGHQSASGGQDFEHLSELYDWMANQL